MRNASPISKLNEVMKILQKVATITDLDRLLRLILKSAKLTASAQASSLMLLDHATNELYFHHIRGGRREVRTIRLKLGQGIAGRVAQTGKPLTVNDVRHSPFFFPEADKKTGFKTRQILCVPLQARRTVIGVLQAINKRGKKGFDREDLILFSTFANQAAVAIENARLYNLASYDGMTRVFTRHYFDVWFESEFARLRRYKRPLSLLMIDLDHFKKINDTHGHPAGDFILASLAQILKAEIRNSDVLARYGGEEFILALTETKGPRAALAAERIRAAVARLPFYYNGKEIRLTVSVGFTTFRQEAGLSAARLVQEADKALYRAKEKRNSAVAFRPTSA